MTHPPIFRPSAAWALLFMRVSAGLLLMFVHGLPKVLHWQTELTMIEDPLGLGAALTLCLAVFAEVLCPILLILGVYARLACVPVLVVLAISLTLVHPDWSLADGQFAWWMIVLFGGLAIAGPGPYRPGRLRHLGGSGCYPGVDMVKQGFIAHLGSGVTPDPVGVGVDLHLRGLQAR